MNETPNQTHPRFPLLGVLLILIGCVIGALSYPVSQASHAISREVQRNVGKEQGRAVVQGAVNAGEKGWRFAVRRRDDNNVFLDIARSIVAILALVWCCCVCLMGFITELVIEPIGRALGVAAQFSVYTMAGFFVGFGVLHMVAGVGALRGRGWTRLLAQSLLVLDGCQGVCFLGASPALWSVDNPTQGIVSLCLGVLLVSVCFPAAWILRQQRRDL